MPYFTRQKTLVLLPRDIFIIAAVHYRKALFSHIEKCGAPSRSKRSPLHCLRAHLYRSFGLAHHVRIVRNARILCLYLYNSIFRAYVKVFWQNKSGFFRYRKTDGKAYWQYAQIRIVFFVIFNILTAALSIEKDNKLAFIPECFLQIDIDFLKINDNIDI